jgi:hypothetical protein
VTYATLRLCSSRGAFEATPEPRLTLDLEAIATRLRAQGVAVTDARVMLLIQLRHEATLSHDGRVLIKCRDPAVAAEVFADLCRRAELPMDDGAPVSRAPASSSTVMAP